jgi:branched-chain amino acid transport system permease protein
MAEFIQICVGGIVVGSVYAVIALGFSLVYRVTGAINLSQGGFCVLAALISYTLRVSWHWPVAAAMPAAVTVTVAVAVVVGRLTFVPALARLSNAGVLMLTVGLLTAIEGAALVIWGSQPFALPPFSGDHPVAWGPILLPTQAFWVVAATSASTASIWYLVARTKIGRSLRACAENPAAASLMGIRVPRMTLFSFALAALIAAIAGVIVAPTTTLQFDTGRLFTILGFVAAVIGGVSSFPGAVIGGLTLGLATQLATAYLSSTYSGTITFAVLLAVLVWRPNGFMNVSARRQDIRDEPRVAAHLIRMPPRASLMLGVSALLVALAVPVAVTDDGLLSGIVIAGILFIALIGLDVIMGYAGQVNLGQAGFMATGGYTAGYLAVAYGVSPILATCAGILLSVACALVLSLVTLRLRGLYLALATLAFGLLVDSLAVGMIDITGGPSGLVGIPPFSIGGIEFGTPRSMYYVVLCVVLMLLFLLSRALGSGFGRALKAIRSDQLAAAALGVNVVRYKLLAFVISAALASLAGSLYAFFFNFLSPDMVGTGRSLELVAMLMIGGEATLIGALPGSLLITLLPTVFQPLALYKTLVTGGLLVASFLYLPQGLYGALAQQLTPRIGNARRTASAQSPQGSAP